MFSIHYLWDRSVKTHTSGDVYIKIDEKKYFLDSSDVMICGSHNAGDNVIEEYSISNYCLLGENEEIPKLRTLKTVTFGVDIIVDGEHLEIERELPITEFSGNTR